MIKLNEKEIEYLKKEMQRVINIWENGTLKELKEYIEYVGGSSLDTVLMFNRSDYKMLNEINTNKFINEKIIDFCIYGLGMFAYKDREFTVEEVTEQIEDEEFCSIYAKLIEDEE